MAGGHVNENGVFSTWANGALAGGIIAAWLQRVVSSSSRPGHRATSSRLQRVRHCSVLSQIKEVLRSEPSSVFTLFYVNRDTPSIIFREALQELKDEYLERFRLFHI